MRGLAYLLIVSGAVLLSGSDNSERELLPELAKDPYDEGASDLKPVERKLSKREVESNQGEWIKEGEELPGQVKYAGVFGGPQDEAFVDLPRSRRVKREQ